MPPPVGVAEFAFSRDEAEFVHEKRDHIFAFRALLFGACGIGTAAAQSAPGGSISVSAYVRLTDPLEQAFSLDVPAGWRSEGGLARRAALQINPYVRSLSADKMTYLMLGEPTLPSFTPPSQMGNAIGHPGRHPL